MGGGQGEGVAFKEGGAWDLTGCGLRGQSGGGAWRRGRGLPVVPAGQLVQTTSWVRCTTAQVAPAGQGHGWQSSEVPLVASP